jgi:hypothetical protein
MNHMMHGQHNQHNELRELARIAEDSQPNDGVSAEANVVDSPDPISPEVIRHRAYLAWDTAGKPIGDRVTFWLAAEKELSAEAVDNWGQGNSQDADRHREIRHPRSLKL